MDYLEGLRSILNEINVGGSSNDTDSTDDENENFMDDSEGDDSSEDDSDEGDENFMDDSGDDNSSDESGEESTDTDDNSDDDENFMDDSDDGGEDSTSESDDSSEDDSSEDENFMDDSGDDNSSDESGEESTDTDDNNEGEESDENNEEESNDYDINKIENELFSSLTPEQIAIKNYELKNQFIELYSIIGSTLVRINDISKSNENVNVLKFITEKLLELREMIDFNITTAYQTRTYIENNIIYQQCIATLNAIAEIIDNIPKLDNKETEEEEIENKGEPVEQDEESSDTLNISDSSMSDYQEESVDYSSDYNDLF